MKFIDLFSGIGGIRLGLEMAGHKCAGFCEFDKFARTAYKAIYETEGEWEAYDIRTVKPYDIPTVPLWCFGFHCQDISIAGKQKGIRGGRSGLFWEIIRLLEGRNKEDRPEWLLIENVKNLLSIGRGFDFARLLCSLGEVGYECEWQVLNSKDFGIPQNRERVFIIGHLGEGSRRKVFPIRPTNGENPCKQQELTKGVADAFRIYDSRGLARTLKAEGGGLGAKTGLFLVPVKISKKSGTPVNNMKIKNVGAQTASCLSARYYKGLSEDNCNGILCIQKTRRKIRCRIRKLTPRECWRLQGFPDWAFDRALAAGISNSRLYQQAGNSVTVNVILAIGVILKEIEDEDPYE